jgi:tRNA(Ile)-lysidine synthase
MTLSLATAIEAFRPDLPLGVAYSGGADSTALLHACAQKWPGSVVALHVNHGLQAAAADFENHCVATCAYLQVELRVARVNAAHRSGQSPEDAARIARYHALESLGIERSGPGAVQTIALAQHADDQVETILLALSRGAGLAGLSGMRADWQRSSIAFSRPLLGVSGAEIRRWLEASGVGFTQDPSNADLRFARNRLRAHLLPALELACPQFRDTFARSAGHAAQALGLLDMLAEGDLREVLRPSDNLPRIKALRQLEVARQSNALRFWLKSTFGVQPSTAQMDELQHQLAACTTRGHQVHIKVGQGFVQRRGEVLAWYNPSLSNPTT